MVWTSLGVSLVLVGTISLFIAGFLDGQDHANQLTVNSGESKFAMWAGAVLWLGGMYMLAAH